MGEMMTLLEVISNINNLNDELTIYAAQPWTVDSTSSVELEPEVGLPFEAKRLSLEYFLEVAVAKEFINGWLMHLNSRPSDKDICERVILYAINDA